MKPFAILLLCALSPLAFGSLFSGFRQGPGQAEGDAGGPSLERTEEDWRLREMELMARIRSLELELVQERALRMQREREWIEFTKLLTLLPESKRPELPGFLQPEGPEVAATEEDSEVQAQSLENTRELERASEIKTTLRAYLRAEGMAAFDLLEVGLVGEGFIGPIVARQLDEQGRFLSTL
ncbi:MAG: hypothetical protein KDB61_04875, partial [Planctomycetes bacterium]|nr:hypothetical protein [Planctomycetota bacterium]